MKRTSLTPIPDSLSAVHSELQNEHALTAVALRARHRSGNLPLRSLLEADRELSALIASHGELLCAKCGKLAVSKSWKEHLAGTTSEGVLLFLVQAHQSPRSERAVFGGKIINVDSDTPTEGLPILVSTDLPLVDAEVERIERALGEFSGRGQLAFYNRSDRSVSEIGFFPFGFRCSHCGAEGPLLHPKSLVSDGVILAVAGKGYQDLLTLSLADLSAVLTKLERLPSERLPNRIARLVELGCGELSLDSPVASFSLLHNLAVDAAILDELLVRGVKVICDDFFGYLPRLEWTLAERALALLNESHGGVEVLDGVRPTWKLDPCNFRDEPPGESGARFVNGQVRHVEPGCPVEWRGASHTMYRLDQIAEELAASGSGSLPLLVAAGFYDAIISEFSHTFEARARGLRSEELSFPKGVLLCPHCGGRGELPQSDGSLRERCAVCCGRRFRTEVNDITAYGVPLGELFNLTGEQLPREMFPSEEASETFEAFLSLGFRGYPLGFFYQRLFRSEQQRVALVRQLTKVRPTGLATTAWYSEGALACASLHISEEFLRIARSIADAGGAVLLAEHLDRSGR